TRQVTRVRRLERGVGQTLTSAVRRGAVLEHREALAEVRDDGRLDDLAGRLRHQAAHGGELTHLLRRTARAGVGHDVDRVEARVLHLLTGLGIREGLAPDAAHHLLGDAIGDTGPDVDHLVVALARGDQTFLV